MMIQKNSSIPRSLYVAMTLQFAIGGAVMPFVTILLRDRGLDFSRISQILLASASTLLVFPFLWGMLADRFIPINRLFTVLNLLAFGCLGFFARQQSFTGLLLSFTLFYACFSPTLTLINAMSFHHMGNPQEQFGGLRAWGSIGWILPSVPIYFWLVQRQNNALDFVVYLGLALTLAMTVITFFLPHTPPGAGISAEGLSERLAYWPAMKRLLGNPNYVTILISFFLMAGSFSLLVFYSPPYLEDQGVDRAWIGPIQSIGVLLEIILFRWLPKILIRWRYTASILIGCCALLLRHLMFAYSESAWLLSASYLLAGMVIVFYYIGTSILVNAIAGREVRATAQTLLVFFGAGMGPMFSNWIAGQLAAAAGDSLRPVFLFAAALAGLAGVLIFLRGSKLDHPG